MDVDYTSAAPVPAPVNPSPPPPPPPRRPEDRAGDADPEYVNVIAGACSKSIRPRTPRSKGDEVIAKLKGTKPLRPRSCDDATTSPPARAALRGGQCVRQPRTPRPQGPEAAAQAEVTERRKLMQTMRARSSQARRPRHVPGPRTPERHFRAGGQAPRRSAASAVIGKLQREPIPVATFKLGSTHSFAGTERGIAIHTRRQRVTCTVAGMSSRQRPMSLPGSIPIST